MLQTDGDYPDIARLELLATAMRRMFDRFSEQERSEWEAERAMSTTEGVFMTALDVTKSLDLHLRFFVDVPIDALQIHDGLEMATIPAWFDRILVNPAVEALKHQLDVQRARALQDVVFRDDHQAHAAENLREDKKIYTAAKAKVRNTTKHWQTTDK